MIVRIKSFWNLGIKTIAKNTSMNASEGRNSLWWLKSDNLTINKRILCTSSGHMWIFILLDKYRENCLKFLLSNYSWYKDYRSNFSNDHWSYCNIKALRPYPSCDKHLELFCYLVPCLNFRRINYHWLPYE